MQVDGRPMADRSIRAIEGDEDGPQTTTLALMAAEEADGDARAEQTGPADLADPADPAESPNNPKDTPSA